MSSNLDVRVARGSGLDSLVGDTALGAMASFVEVLRNQCKITSRYLDCKDQKSEWEKIEKGQTKRQGPF